MDKLIIIVPLPPAADISANEKWRDALHELQSLQATQVTRIWHTHNVAVLEGKKDEGLAKQIAVFLQNKNVKHYLYQAIECNQMMSDYYHKAL